VGEGVGEALGERVLLPQPDDVAERVGEGDAEAQREGERVSVGEAL